jgi:type IV pilus assembly protein PilX
MNTAVEPRHAQQAQQAQRGVTLIITLVMLVLITLVGVASIRNSTMDEKMAGNSRDRGKALQAAEAAVRVCLGKVQADTVAAALKLAPAASPATPLWDVDTNWAAASTTSESVSITTGTLAQAGLAEWPRCMYETLDAAAGSYRVTGRAVGASTLSVVMLQATYATD